MGRVLLLFLSLVLPLAAQDGKADREFTVKSLDRIAKPVLESLAAGKLKAQMPLGPGEKGRASYTCLEAFGRTMAGISPWLALGPDKTPEGRLRERYILLSRQALVMATAPDSPDRMNFSEGGQPLVDAAFLSQALLQAPAQLWEPLKEEEKANLADALKQTRKIKPPQNNWLLFSALVEAALWKLTGECEMPPIQRALEKHEQWYLGDGVYGDGPEFHWDYYNSFVIQPAMLAVLDVCREKNHELASRWPAVLGRAKRYAAVQERLISPEGTYPVMGRSSAYRFGAFQHLSMMARRGELPQDLEPAAVRGALTAVIRRTLAAPDTFDKEGWLRVGAVGYQPSIREGYISTGSLYLCLAGMQHLGLRANDPFWTAAPKAWTQKRIWAGEDVKADHAHGK
ncbi:DUF2264 domain-containing protein [Luteolibacter sp. Populi]|uniref:DUF2264 domain-containing protein n=1 Tax=Luteolibacter sp. Populi TaxID=3230487 RepID=UPI0034652802